MRTQDTVEEDPRVLCWLKSCSCVPCTTSDFNEVTSWISLSCSKPGHGDRFR